VLANASGLQLNSLQPLRRLRDGHHQLTGNVMVPSQNQNRGRCIYDNFQTIASPPLTMKVN
jgi:hypothetical protein